MQYKIMGYDESLDTHLLSSRDGLRLLRVDLFVDCSFVDEPKNWDENTPIEKIFEYKKGIVGKWIEIENTFPFILIAQGVKIL